MSFMEMPLISIGMLTYNHETYVLEALKSLVSQTYEQIELIILDDASTDTTSQVIEQYMQKLKDRFVRVVYIKNKRNCGSISRNCNCMLKEMKGEFCFEFSGDDILFPQCITLLHEKLQGHPECMVIHANAIQIEDTYIYGDEVKNSNIIWKNRVSGIEPDNFFYQLMYDNRVVALTAMFRKEVVGIYGYHDENIMYEDYEYWIRISREEKFYYYNEPVGLYRKARTSITNFEKENSWHNLRVAINSDYQTKKKYIGQLTEYERMVCWKKFYMRYMEACLQSQYQEGIKWLENKRRQDKIDIEYKQKIDYVERYERGCAEADILATWVGIKSFPHSLGNYLKKRGVNKVAIYGYYSRMACVLEKELSNEEICIDYIIDREGRLHESRFRVYTIEDALPYVDAVIVAPVGLYEEMGTVLCRLRDIKFMDLKRIIKDLSDELKV